MNTLPLYILVFDGPDLGFFPDTLYVRGDEAVAREIAYYTSLGFTLVSKTRAIDKFIA